MAKARTKGIRIRKAPAPPRPAYEATPERLAQAGPEHTALVTGNIDRAGQRPELARRFSDSHIDRMLRAKRITFAQWYAADWYREVYELTGIGGRVCSRYDITHAGATGTSYGMATTERQAAARIKFRTARACIPANMLALVEKIVLHDMAPALANGQQRDRYGRRIGAALQPIAEWLNAPTTA